ncbi:peptide chain release factor N(5)-glutamine methyltransferase [Yaniella flava]|uniref:peptide chain release factor N(5)-glutamine methyltransferase n=1 Tax=Yaniella flava TaxID=287930 RepID=A0ABP5FS03_9MICC
MPEVNHVIRDVQNRLTQAGIESPHAEATLIVAHILEVERGRLGVMQALGESIDENTVAKIDQLVAARVTRVPLQHLTGEAGFYGLELKVEPGVFIPRVETEILVETTLEHFSGAAGPLKILDLCTGTGAIAAALSHRLGKQHVETMLWAVELEPQAVQLAQHNTADYKVTVLCADATDADEMVAADPDLAELIGTFDAVVSNPPYIPTHTRVSQREADQDPALALYGGSADGTYIPRLITEQALKWLAPGGFFMMEHDHTHAESIADTLRQNPGWKHVATVQDLTTTDRFVSAIRA